MNRTLVSRTFDRSQLQTDDNTFDVPTFGKPTSNNYGWVKCDSRSFPGMSYYFNVNTCCSTWIRPVPTFVATPYFRPESLPTDEEFPDRTPLQVSDIEDDEENEQQWDFGKDTKSLFVSKKEAKQKKMYAEVLYKMYHCYGDEWDIDVIDGVTSMENDPSLCNCESIDENAWSNDPQLILPDICYSSSSKSESSDSSSTESRCIETRMQSDSPDCTNTLIAKTKKTFKRMGVKLGDLGYREKFDSGFIIDCHRSSPVDGLDDNDNEVDFKIDDQDKPSMMSISNSEDSDMDFRPVKLSSRDDEENDEEENGDDEEEEEEEEKEEEEEEEEEEVGVKHYNGQFSLPKLKSIQLSDLLSSPRKVKIAKKNLRRKRYRNESVKMKEDSENISPKRVKKMTFEMNGVKTINYDFITPELPPGVKMSNLSDSSSSTIYDRWYSLYDREKSGKKFLNGAKTKLEQIIENDFVDVNEPDLSDSSTSCSNSQKLRQDTRTDGSNVSHTTKDSESSSSSLSSTNSKNDPKTFSNVARANELSDSDSSETSSTSCSTASKSLENKIKKLPDDIGLIVKKENLDMNECSPSNSKEQRIVKSFDKSSKVCTYIDDDIFLYSSTSMTSPSNSSDVTWKLSDYSGSDED